MVRELPVGTQRGDKPNHTLGTLFAA